MVRNTRRPFSGRRGQPGDQRRGTGNRRGSRAWTMRRTWLGIEYLRAQGNGVRVSYDRQRIRQSHFWRRGWRHSRGAVAATAHQWRRRSLCVRSDSTTDDMGFVAALAATTRNVTGIVCRFKRCGGGAASRGNMLCHAAENRLTLSASLSGAALGRFGS